MSSPKRNCLLVFVGYFLFNLNRRCVIYQFPKLLPEFDLKPTDAGTISSSQQFSTSLVTFAGGILSDFIPSEVLFPFGLIVCGLSTISFSFGQSTAAFSFFWFFNGIGQGLRVPAALRLTKQFSEPATFATNWSLVLIGVNVAGIITPILSSVISSVQWQTVVRACGLIVLAYGFYILREFHFNPVKTVKNGKVSSLKKKEDDQKPAKRSLSLMTIFSFPILWIVILNYFTTGFYRMSLDWATLYFDELGLPESIAHYYITVFELSSVFGKIFSGRVNDHFITKPLAKISTALVRLPIVISFMGASIFAHWAFCFFINKHSSVILLALIGFFSGVTSAGNIVTLSVLSTEISDASYSGLVSSICTTSTKVGAFTSGYPLTLMALYFGWQGAFTAILLLICAVTGISVIFYVQCYRAISSSSSDKHRKTSETSTVSYKTHKLKIQ